MQSLDLPGLTSDQKHWAWRLEHLSTEVLQSIIKGGTPNETGTLVRISPDMLMSGGAFLADAQKAAQQLLIRRGVTDIVLN